MRSNQIATFEPNPSQIPESQPERLDEPNPSQIPQSQPEMGAPLSACRCQPEEEEEEEEYVHVTERWVWQFKGELCAVAWGNQETAAIARKQQHQYLHQHQHQHQHWQILTILESRARVRLEGRDGWHLPLARTRRSCGGMVSRWAKLGVRGNQSGDHWGCSQEAASAWKGDDAYYG